MAWRRIIIGDIHGCYSALERLLKQSGYTAGTDELIFVGDLFDRGCYSAEVYKYVKSLKEANSDMVTVVYGNHEDMLVHALGSEEDMRLWDYNGAEVTKESFGEAGIEISDVADWIKRNVVAYYECPEFFVCHGGTMYDDPKNESLYALVWDRETFLSGNRHAKLIITGHTPIDNPVWRCMPDGAVYDYDSEYELPANGILNIDTGCVFGGRLTAMIVEGNRFRLAAEVRDIVRDTD